MDVSYYNPNAMGHEGESIWEGYYASINIIQAMASPVFLGTREKGMDAPRPARLWQPHEIVVS